MVRISVGGYSDNTIGKSVLDCPIGYSLELDEILIRFSEDQIEWSPEKVQRWLQHEILHSVLNRIVSEEASIKLDNISSKHGSIEVV